MNKTVVGILIVVAAIIISILIIKPENNSKKDSNSENQVTQVMETEKAEPVVTNTAPQMKSEVATMSTAGTYSEYTKEKLEMAKDTKIVLFFNASWCPTCRAVDSEIAKNGVDSGVTLLKVDYDNSTDLKKKYKVTTQHTFVQVDSMGNMITSWRGGSAAQISTMIK